MPRTKSAKAIPDDTPPAANRRTLPQLMARNSATIRRGLCLLRNHHPGLTEDLDQLIDQVDKGYSAMLDLVPESAW